MGLDEITELGFEKFVAHQCLRIPDDTEIEYTDELHNMMYELWELYLFCGIDEVYWSERTE